MRKEEVVIRIIGNLDAVYGDIIDRQKVKNMIEEVLCDFNVTPKVTALAVLDDMQDKIMLYLMAKKLEGVSSNTIKSYGRTLKRFSEELRKNVDDVTTMDIRRYLALYTQKGVKNSTIANITDILRGFFGWLEVEEYIAKSPIRNIKNIKVEKCLREALTYEEMEILRNGCRTLRQKAILEFAYATCTRLGEIENVKISDILWSEMKLNVFGKGGKERTVYINARAKVSLERYLSSRDDSCDMLFVTERKPIKALGRRAIQREIDKIQQQSGLNKNVFPHLLRHSGASHMLDKNVSINTIKKILGHENLSTTEIYAKTSSTNVEHEYKKCMNG